MKDIVAKLLIIFLVTSCGTKKEVQWWPQFRGPQSSGVASEKAKPPVNFEAQNLKWETELPAGFSSPVIWDNKIFLTGFIEDKEELTTLCLNRIDGKILWQQSFIPDTLEKTHSISNPAQSTPATDGERVVAYFGSCGLICYNMEGEVQWEYDKPVPKFAFGNAASPVIAGDRIILLDDEGTERYLMAIDKSTGREIWKKEFELDTLSGWGGDATPLIYKDKIIVHRVGEVAAYAVNDGSYLWSYKTLTEASGSPVIAEDKILISCWFNLNDDAERLEIPDFKELVQKYDTSKNGKISKQELPDNLMLTQRSEMKEIERTSTSAKDAFGRIDENGDFEIDEREWLIIIENLKILTKPSGFIAIKADSKGELNDSAVIWMITKNIAEVPSPIFYKNRAYMVKDGGFITCVDPENGNVVYQTRIGNPGPHMASPIAANGHLYIFGYNGKLKVLKAGDEFQIVGEHDFKENIGATPAIIGNTIYVRTKGRLLAYSEKK